MPTALSSIRIWHNKITDAPSVEVGPIAIDLGTETPAQELLFELVTNHPDAIVQGHIEAPFTAEIAKAFQAVIEDEIATFQVERE